MPAFLVAQEATPEGVTIHVVQRGENLFRIALSYGLTVDELAKLNGITDPGNLQVGQRLLVPVVGGGATPQPETHTVQAGETLQGIADLYGVTVEQLAEWNQIADVDSIYVGQVLVVTPPSEPPPDDTTPASTSPTNAPKVAVAPNSPPVNLVYVVQSGETLFSIATRYGVTVNDLASANSISDPTLIYAGQQIVIPGVKPPQFAVDLPSPVKALDVTPIILVDGQTGRFRVTTSAAAIVTITFLGRDLPVVPDQSNTIDTSLVGIPLGTPAGIYPVTLSATPAGGPPVKFTVNVQIITIDYSGEAEALDLPQEKVDLLSPTLEQREVDLLRSVTSAFSPQRDFNGPLGLPAAAVMVAPFGVSRTYNGGVLTSVHLGVDFAGAPGSPIMAAAAGKVVLADTLNIRGMVTVIDHGWGVYTTYSHQSQRYVKLGETVAAGQVIGAVGATGRATGPHLHWEVWVDGVPVDPMQWLQQSFS
jgi:murein DD-endopeptidase MepM/ murein hydrolase activator NlpD